MHIYIYAYIYIYIYHTVIVIYINICDSVLHVYILFQILFPYRLSQNIKYSSLCYTVDLVWLSIMYIYTDDRYICMCVLILTINLFLLNNF